MRRKGSESTGKQRRREEDKDMRGDDRRGKEELILGRVEEAE